MSAVTSLASVETPQVLERYALELHEFLDGLPRNLRRGRSEELRNRCQKLCDEMPGTAGDDRLKAAWAHTKDRLSEMNTALANSSTKAYLLARHEELSRTYEDWVRAFRSDTQACGSIRLPSLRPLVGARTIFHMAMGITGTVLYQFFLTRFQATAVLLSLLSIMGALEISRRCSTRWNHILATKVFRSIGRPHEYHGTNSGTYYLIGLVLLTPFFSRPAVLTGVLILAFSDPAAAWFGKKFGKTKLYKQKSYVGTAAFVAVGIAVSSAFLLLFYPEIPFQHRILVPVVASIVAAIAELFSGRFDDNLTIPVAAVLTAAAFI